jgi:type IV secretory pathway VirD2 relaxase
MVAATYDEVLEATRRLTSEEQRRLHDEIETLLGAEPIPALLQRAGRVARPGLEADLDAIDELAAEIGAAWKDDMSAAEAVSEQRREL